MKNIIKVLICSYFVVLTTLNASAQKKYTEGVLTYGLEYNLPADKQAMAAMLPQEYKINFKGSSCKFKMDMGMFSTVVIYNGDTQETLSLTEVPIQNKKIAVKMNKEQSEKLAELQGSLKDFEFSETTDTKVINGFNCKKYICTDKDSGAKFDLWATNDFDLPANSLTYNYKSLKAIPVKFIMENKGFKSTLTLKQISEEKIEPLLMDIPKDYEIMTFDDLMKQMGG